MIPVTPQARLALAITWTALCAVAALRPEGKVARVVNVVKPLLGPEITPPLWKNAANLHPQVEHAQKFDDGVKVYGAHVHADEAGPLGSPCDCPHCRGLCREPCGRGYLVRGQPLRNLGRIALAPLRWLFRRRC